ncbi:hypothetical protein PR002_g32341 [Phytophthora rubi]|uniref:Reverse transcriptase/retrotransposon-derived protein RNase H-like domain-containing protein n=1 Tax=Phytophthora rubi TaxID=129364 RepID=A0A6A3G9K5_9STRA|nr:hypothetical protein PR002_g32341 [Phytophthora rubi]
MRQSIPEYTRITANLYHALERAAKISGSRKKNMLVKIRLDDVGWGDTEIDSFENIRGALLRMVPLAHPSPTAEVALYTDASQDFWGAMVAQLEPLEERLRAGRPSKRRRSP